MLRTYQHSAGRYRPPTATSRPTIIVLRAFFGALRDGLAACREYQHLRSWGVSHDTALREALGIGPSPSHGTCKRTKPLCFAGKA